ncbi:MAG: hypothetical protein ACOH1I_05165 [Gallionellaceae bacterium]|jgi:hypothetical protein
MVVLAKGIHADFTKSGGDCKQLRGASASDATEFFCIADTYSLRQLSDIYLLALKMVRQ